LLSGAIGGTTQELCWTVVVLVLYFGTRVGGGYEIQPAHFVERHALLVIIAIGEAVVATGVAARHVTVDLTLVIAAVLGLLLSAGLWWSYFGGEDGDSARVERAFATATGPQRPRVALYGFGYAHYVMLLGVVLTAVGLKAAVAQAGNAMTTAGAFALTIGVAIFLLGLAWFRVILGLRSWRLTDGFALALLIAVPAATAVSGLCGLAVLLAGLGAMLRLETGPARNLTGYDRLPYGPP
jgi:low temperature requirement protein LtrA